MCNACIFSLRFKTSLYLSGHKQKQPLYFRGFCEWEGAVMYSAELTHFICVCFCPLNKGVTVYKKKEYSVCCWSLTTSVNLVGLRTTMETTPVHIGERLGRLKWKDHPKCGQHHCTG